MAAEDLLSAVAVAGIISAESLLQRLNGCDFKVRGLSDVRTLTGKVITTNNLITDCPCSRTLIQYLLTHF